MVHAAEYTYISFRLYLDMALLRQEPEAYSDGVYAIAGKDRPDPILISNMTQSGFSGNGSRTRTALFIYFGKWHD